MKTLTNKTVGGEDIVTEFDAEFNADYNRYNFMNYARPAIEVVREDGKLKLIKHRDSNWQHGIKGFKCDRQFCEICT